MKLRADAAYIWYTKIMYRYVLVKTVMRPYPKNADPIMGDQMLMLGCVALLATISLHPP